MSTFRLMSSNPLWKQEFEQTRSSLLAASEGWLNRCEHIGSTAVEDCIARPTVDVLAGVVDLAGLNEVAGLIEGLNFRRLPSPAWCDDELTAFLEKPRIGEATHSVLIARIDSAAWTSALTIRDGIQKSEQLKEELETIKRANYQSDCGAADRYRAAKQAFFENLSS